MKPLIPIALLLLADTAPSAAPAVHIGHDQYVVLLRNVDRHPETPQGAQRTLAQIADAAMAICGGDRTSPLVVQRALRRSACWRETVADTVHRIGDPLLSQAHHHQP